MSRLDQCSSQLCFRCPSSALSAHHPAQVWLLPLLLPLLPLLPLRLLLHLLLALPPLALAPLVLPPSPLQRPWLRSGALTLLPMR